MNKLSNILLAASFSIFSLGVFAQTTGTLLLNGNVPQILSIAVNPEPIAANLPLDETQVDTKVASVHEMSNSVSGYQVSVSSMNQGALVHESVSSSFVSYQLKYDGSVVDLSGDTFSHPASSAVSVHRDVEISYTGVDHEQLIEGNYLDTVTFTISAN